MSDKLQKIAVGLLIAALVLLFLKEILLCYIVLGCVLGIDLYLVRKKEPTITQWFRPKLPKRVDTILAIALCAAFIILDPTRISGLYFLMGTINGHLNADW